MEEMMTACRLTPVNTASCDWNASPGQVSLELKSIRGSVAFEPQTRYSGGTITFDSSTQITFNIVAGKSTLSAVYVVFDPDNGPGTLAEVSDQSTRVDNVTADYP